MSDAHPSSDPATDAAALREALALVIACALVATPARAEDRQRYSMEFEEIAVRAATCRPTRAIPDPCPRRPRQSRPRTR